MLCFLLLYTSSSCMDFSAAHWAPGRQSSVSTTAAAGRRRCTPHRREAAQSMWQKRCGNGERMCHQGISAACLVSSSLIPILCVLQAAAEPVAVGSEHHPLHSAWHPPARGLTFPEVLSHSASCYSLWQVELDHSECQQTWTRARWGATVTLVTDLPSRKCWDLKVFTEDWAKCQSHIWSCTLPLVSVRCEEWCKVKAGDGLMKGKGIAVTALRCQRSDCPKPNFMANFLGYSSREWHESPHPEVKIVAWCTCHFALCAVAAHHEGVWDHPFIQPVSWRFIGRFREKVTLQNWLMPPPPPPPPPTPTHTRTDNSFGLFFPLL